MYEVGKVYIWQHQVGDVAYLNGTETTITSGPSKTYRYSTGKDEICWETDSSPPPPHSIKHYVLVAFAGDLRLKDPPSGQRSILELFKQPELEIA